MPTAVKPQNYANHRALAPWYLVAGLVLVVNFGGRAIDVAHELRFGTVMDVLVAAALVVVWGVSRRKAQMMQDRIIRLEMRLRLERVLPPEQRADIAKLSLGQLVALRFASDAELPTLARQVLDQNLTDRKVIKKLVKNWQADHLRA
jgi:hypothetical protein